MYTQFMTITLFSQAMSALLCCGSCFDTLNLAEDGNIYMWLDLLLTSSDDKVRIFQNGLFTSSNLDDHNYQTFQFT